MKFKCVWNGERVELVPVEQAERIPKPNVITDECEPFQSMVDGSIWTSKAAYRRHLRANKMIEVGNDVDGFKEVNPFETEEYNRQLKEDLTRAYYETRDKMAPLSEYDRARCERINKQQKRNDYDRRERDRYGRVRD